jgi:hypothetical protein
MVPGGLAHDPLDHVAVDRAAGVPTRCREAKAHRRPIAPQRLHAPGDGKPATGGAQRLWV